VGSKEKNYGKEVRDKYHWTVGRNSILLLEGFQAMPARPCDKNIITVKTLKW
jgi:hypothetical protein